MNATAGTLRRLLPIVIVLALLGALVYWAFGRGSDEKTLTAYFPRTVSLYEGSDVRVLGVRIGHVDKVVPEGQQVKVVMKYDDEVSVPIEAKAVIIAPSVVGDRYVQLTPPFKSGEVLEDNAQLDGGRTQVPLELDEIYASFDRLTVALGPNGANAEGALTDLLQVTAENFGGLGEEFHDTIGNFAKLSTTLSNNREELFGSAAQLQKFITTLAENDQTVRDFNTSLGEVSDLLAGERDELSQALKNLGTALTQVGTFVQENRDKLGENIRGINRVAKVLVKQRTAIDEILRLAPVALSNLQLTYNPDTGTLDTNANLGTIEGKITSDPKGFLCALVAANDNTGTLCKLIKTLPLPRTLPFGPGNGSSSNVQTDPTLGGLVGVRS